MYEMEIILNENYSHCTYKSTSSRIRVWNDFCIHLGKRPHFHIALDARTPDGGDEDVNGTGVAVSLCLCDSCVVIAGVTWTWKSRMDGWVAKISGWYARECICMFKRWERKSRYRCFVCVMSCVCWTICIKSHLWWCDAGTHLTHVQSNVFELIPALTTRGLSDWLRRAESLFSRWYKVECLSPLPSPSLLI